MRATNVERATAPRARSSQGPSGSMRKTIEVKR
jgi:hypothetical protein